MGFIKKLLSFFCCCSTNNDNNDPPIYVDPQPKQEEKRRTSKPTMTAFGINNEWATCDKDNFETSMFKDNTYVAKRNVDDVEITRMEQGIQAEMIHEFHKKYGIIPEVRMEDRVVKVSTDDIEYKSKQLRAKESIETIMEHRRREEAMMLRLVNNHGDKPFTRKDELFFNNYDQVDYGAA